MNKKVFVFMVSVVCIALVSGCSRWFGSSEDVLIPADMCNEDMSFDNFPTLYEYKGDMVAVNVSKIFDTVKKEAIINTVEKGPNFADSYTVASWQCGEWCQKHAVINMKSGNIIGEFETEYGVAFRPDSKLIVANPEYAVRETGLSGISFDTTYYLVQDDGLQVACIREMIFEDIASGDRKIIE